MPRKPDIDPPTRTEITLPESMRVRLDLILSSPLEGRVPKGKYREFWMTRLSEFFSSKRLDLTPFGFAPGFYVFGPREMVDALEKALKGTQNG